MGNRATYYLNKIWLVLFYTSLSMWYQGEKANRKYKEQKRALSGIQSLFHVCCPAFEGTVLEYIRLKGKADLD